MKAKRRRPIPLFLDGVIWQLMEDTAQKGGNLSETARQIEHWLRTTTQFDLSDDASAEINKNAHTISTVGMANSPKYALQSLAAKQYTAARRAGEPVKRRLWGWLSILKRYYKLRDGTTPAGQRLRRHMAPK